MADRLSKLPNLPAHPAKDFTKRLHERVLTATGKPYVVFDPALETSYVSFVTALRRDHDAHDETRIFANGLKEHLDRVDAREAAHHQTQASAIAELREELGNRPFLSGRG